MQHYKLVSRVHMSMDALKLLASICEMLSCSLSMSCARKTSTVHYPDTHVLPSGTVTSA